MADSTRQQILEAVRTRVRPLEADPDVAPVCLGYTPEFGPDDPPLAVAIVVGDQATGLMARKELERLILEIQLLANVDLDEPWLAIEALLAKAKQAIELEDRLLGGLLKTPLTRESTRTLSREDGATAVGAVLTYSCGYAEPWGQP